jgi:hypothetical protein
MITLLDDVKLDTLALGEGDLALVLVSDHKHVLGTGREGVASGIADDGDVERTGVLLDVGHDSDTTTVSALGDHAHVAGLELDSLDDLASGDIDLDGIIGLDQRIGVADGAAIMGDNNGDLLQSDVASVDTAQLELLLLIRHTVKDEAALAIVYKTESIGSLGHLDNIHESSGEVRVSADLSVNSDKLLHADHLGLLAGKSILQSVSQDEHEGKALTELVGSLGRSGGLEEEKKSSPILDNDYSLTHSHSITHSLTHTVIAHYTHTTPSHTHTHSFTQYTTTLIQHHTSRSHSFLTHYSPRYRPSWTTSNAWAYSNASNAS